MSVSIEPPSKLVFGVSTTRALSKTETVRITNLGESLVGFKIKTTAPKQYCVKPSAGVIEPHQEKCIQVLRQPSGSNVRDRPTPKDKFLIQTAEMKAEDAECSLAEWWQRIESEHSDLIHRHKIKCVVPHIRELESDTACDKKRYSSDSITLAGDEDRGVMTCPGSASASIMGFEGVKAMTMTPVPPNNDEIKKLSEELAKANETIEQLREQLEKQKQASKEVFKTQKKTNLKGEVEVLTKSEKGHPLAVVWTATTLTFITAYLLL